MKRVALLGFVNVFLCSMYMCGMEEPSDWRAYDQGPTIPAYIGESKVYNVPLYLLPLSKKLQSLRSEPGIYMTTIFAKPSANVCIGVFDFLKLFIAKEGEKRTPSKDELDTVFKFKKSEFIKEFLDLLHALEVVPEIIKQAEELLVYLQFSDPVNDSGKQYIYPRYDLLFFTTLKDLLEQEQTDSIHVPRSTRAQLDAARDLLEYCMTSDAVVKQLHYHQRNKVREFFAKKDFSSLHDLLVCLDFLNGPTLLLKLTCAEYAQRVKNMDSLNAITATLPFGLAYDMRSYFIDPVLQYIKGLGDIIKIENIEAEKIVLPFSNNNSFNPLFISSLNSNIVAKVVSGGIRFLNLITGTTYVSTKIRFGYMDNILDHKGTVMASIHKNDPIVVLHAITNEKRNARLVDIRKDRSIGEAFPSCCCFSPDDTQLIVGYDNGWLVVYDVKDGKTIAKHPYFETGTITSVACHPHDNTMIALTCGRSALVVYPHVDQYGQITERLGLQKFLDNVALQSITRKAHKIIFTPDGEHIIVFYELRKGGICCTQYSAIDFSMQCSTGVQKTPNKNNDIIVRMYSNNTRYVVHRRSYDEGSIYTGAIGSMTLHDCGVSNYMSLCGDLLKYVGFDNVLELSSLQGERYLLKSTSDISSIVDQPYAIFSCFNEDGTKLKVCTDEHTITTLQLYNDCWIRFFTYIQTHSFSLQELHTLYKNYLKILARRTIIPATEDSEEEVVNIPTDQVFAQLIEGMSDDFKQEVQRCIKIVPKKKAIAPKPALSVLASWAKQRLGLGGGPAQLPPELQPLEAPAPPIQQVVQAQNNQPPIIQVPEVPVVEQRQGKPEVPGFFTRTLNFVGSIITAPFRFVGWITRGIWHGVFG
jgi:hypothetical protein